MKKTLITPLLLTLPFSAAAGSGVGGDISEVPEQAFTNSQLNLHGYVGVGTIRTDTFDGVDHQETSAIPLINVNYNDTYYFALNKLGAWFYKYQYESKYMDRYDFRLGAIAQPKRGYDIGDGPIADHEVDDQVLLGLRAQFKTGRLSVDSSLLQSTESDSGAEWNVSLQYTLVAAQYGTLTAFAKAEVLDQDTIDYLYYKSGAIAGAESAANYTYGLASTVNINKNWSVIASVFSKAHGDAIKDAQGVTESHNESAVLGVIYKF